MNSTNEYIELTEYKKVSLNHHLISESTGKYIWQNHSGHVTIEFPSIKTNNQWDLRSQGWVGYIPLPEGLTLHLMPKVSLGNLFKMLEYAYKLNSFKFLEGLVDCNSIEDYYNRLASLLSKMVLKRSRKGLYKEYSHRESKLPYVRGKIDSSRILPWNINLHCQYEEHTADIEENQIIAWTLNCISRSGICREDVMLIVRRAFREFQGDISVIPYYPYHCTGRHYNRLNNDYQPLHALCRFFLDYSGPAYDIGSKRVIPFLVNMNYLFELFVVEWLKINLPSDIELKEQEHLKLDRSGDYYFKPDICLYNRYTKEPLCVLDTKYIVQDATTADEIAQVMAYAQVLGCKEAVLIYPDNLKKQLDTMVGNIRVRSLVFNITGEIDQAGNDLLGMLDLEAVKL